MSVDHLINMSGELTVNVRDNIAGANATQIIDTVIRQPTASIQACLRALDCPDAGAIKTEIHSADGVILECIEWIFQDDRFLKWKDPGENSVLWINGSPGKGKTRMATGIVDSLLKETDDTTVNGIAGFFFCQSTDDRLNSAVDILKGIIRSLIEHRPLVVEHLHRHWIDEEQKFDKDFNQIAPLWAVLKRIINDHGHLVTYIVIDAIDECSHQTEELLRLIFTDGLAFPRSIKWLLTSRPLSLRLQEIIYGSSEPIEVDLDGFSGQLEDAVKRYIKVKTRWMNYNRFSMDDQAHISELLFTKSGSTFLWVAFVCQEVRNLPAAEVIRAVLAMPKGLRNLYERSMQLLDQACHNSDEFAIDHRKLIWTLHSLSSSPHMLELAMLAGFPTERANDESYLLRVIRERNTFLILNKDDAVRLVHKSVDDYLHEVQSLTPQLAMPPSQELIARRYIQILQTSLCRNIAKLRAVDSDAEGACTKLLNKISIKVGYSCIHWLDHVTRSGTSRCALTVYVFLQRHLLHWIEVMSLLNRTDTCRGQLLQLEASIEAMSSGNPLPSQWSLIFDFVKSARDFATSNGNLVRRWPLQVYSSSLVFFSTHEGFSKAFEGEHPAWISDHFVPALRMWYPTPSITIEHGHEENVQAMLSKNGERLVTVSHNSCKIWNLIEPQRFTRLQATHHSSKLQMEFLPEEKQFEAIWTAVIPVEHPQAQMQCLYRETWQCDSGTSSVRSQTPILTPIDEFSDPLIRFCHPNCISTDGKLLAALDKTHSKLRSWSTVEYEELPFVHLRFLEAELPSIDLHILVAELPMLEHETLQFCCNDKFIVYEAHDERKQFLLVCDLEKADVMVQTECIDHNRTWMQYPWAISPGGEYFASTTQGDKSLPFVAKISIREIPTRRVMFTILVSAISGLALSTNPLRVAAASHDGTIRVWDIDEARSHDYVQSAIDIYSGIPSTSSRILSLSKSWMGGCFQCLAAAWLPSPDCEFLLFLGSRDGLSKNLLTLAHTSCGYSRDILGPWELGTILTCTFSPDGSLLTICYYVEDSSFSGGRSSGTFLTTYEVSIEHLHDQSFDPLQLSLWTSHVITTADDTERTTLATKPASAAVTYSEDQSLILCSFLIGNRAVFGELDVHDRSGKYALVDLKSSLLTDRACTTQAICVSPDHHLIACSFSLKTHQGPSCVNCKQVHEVSRVYILQDYRYHSDAFRFEAQDVSLLKFSHSAELLVALSEERQHIKVFKIPQISGKTSHDATDPPQQLHLIAEFTDHGFISDVEFTKNNRALRTNRGTIQLFSDLPSASLSSAAPLPGLYFDGQWICMMENPILYIPAEYRPASGNRKLGFLEHKSVIIQGSWVIFRTVTRHILKLKFDRQLIWKILSRGELL
ncbi:MAG: NAD(P)-binding protein [Aureobasidium pullulans]|nr:MAG: NAD(P)-binding protein [Aureobasidium pullulans]